MTNSADPDQKPPDLGLHYLERQGISGTGRTRVKGRNTHVGDFPPYFTRSTPFVTFCLVSYTSISFCKVVCFKRPIWTESSPKYVSIPFKTEHTFWKELSGIPKNTHFLLFRYDPEVWNIHNKLICKYLHSMCFDNTHLIFIIFALYIKNHQNTFWI